jgi:hypothetical protein
MKKHAGAYLEGCIASELKMGWRVGRIQVCVRVVPACDRCACGADIVNVEVRADNLQGLLPNSRCHGRARRAEHARAAGSRGRGILHGPERPHPYLGRLHRGAATRAYPRRLFTRQGSWRGPPELSAADILEGKVQGTAAERRSQFQPLDRPLRGQTLFVQVW